MNRTPIVRPQVPNLFGKSSALEKQPSDLLMRRTSYLEMGGSSYDMEQLKRPFAELVRAINLQIADNRAIMSSHIKSVEETRRGMDQMKSLFLDFLNNNKKQTNDTETIKAIIAVEVEKRLKEVLIPYVTKTEVEGALNSTYTSTTGMIDSFNKAMDEFYSRMNKIEDELELIKDRQVEIELMTKGIEDVDHLNPKEGNSFLLESTKEAQSWIETIPEQNKFSSEGQDKDIRIETMSSSSSVQYQDLDHTGDEVETSHSEEKTVLTTIRESEKDYSHKDGIVDLKSDLVKTVPVQNVEIDSDDEKSSDVQNTTNVHAEFSNGMMKVKLENVKSGSVFRVYGSKQKFVTKIIETEARPQSGNSSESVKCLIQAVHHKGINLLKLISIEDRSDRLWKIPLTTSIEFQTV